MPIGPHILLSFLAEPLKQPEETLLSVEEDDVSENLEEFKDWVCLITYSPLTLPMPIIIISVMTLKFLSHYNQREYYACDATYRNWLKFELENGAIPPSELSSEEKDRAIAAAVETLNTSLTLLLSKYILCTFSSLLLSYMHDVLNLNDMNIFISCLSLTKLALQIFTVIWVVKSLKTIWVVGKQVLGRVLPFAGRLLSDSMWSQWDGGLVTRLWWCDLQFKQWMRQHMRCNQQDVKVGGPEIQRCRHRAGVDTIGFAGRRIVLGVQWKFNEVLIWSNQSYNHNPNLASF